MELTYAVVLSFKHSCSTQVFCIKAEFASTVRTVNCVDFTRMVGSCYSLPGFNLNLTEEYLLVDSVIHRDKSGFPLILFHGATPRLVQESNDVSQTEPGVPYYQCQL